MHGISLASHWHRGCQSLALASALGVRVPNVPEGLDFEYCERKHSEGHCTVPCLEHTSSLISIKLLWPDDDTVQELIPRPVYILLICVYYWPCMCDSERSFAIYWQRACLFAACLAKYPYLRTKTLYCGQIAGRSNVAMIGVAFRRFEEHKVVQFSAAPSAPHMAVKLIATAILLFVDRNRLSEVERITREAKRMYSGRPFVQGHYV